MPTPIIANYTFHEAQGTGTFGTVYRAEWDGRLDCAVKIFNKASINEAYVSWCLEKLRGEERHPNIIPVLGFDLVQVPAYAAYGWVPTPANGIRTLEDAAGKWSFSEVSGALMGLAGAMAWLHERGIIHTGITSGNVLLLNESPGSVCVTDVGQGLIDAAQAANWLSHAPFLSPERCRHEAPQGESSGEAWDVYAFGMVAFHLLTGRKHARAVEYFKKIQKQQLGADGRLTVDLGELANQLDREKTLAWRSRVNSDAEEQTRELVERCLALSLDLRYGHMREVMQDLEKIDFSALQPALKTAPAPTPDKSKSVRQRKATEPAAPAPKPSAMPELGTTKAMAKQAKREAAQAAASEKSEPTEDRTPWQEKLRSVMPKSLPSANGGIMIAVGAAALLAASVAGWQYRQRNLADSEVRNLQTSMQEMQRKASADEAAAKEQLAAAAQAVTEQKRLRINLRQEQEMGDQLLETLLEQRPSDEHEAEVWKGRLTDYAAQVSERLKVMSQDPSLKESSARTRWNMAGITMALGEPKAASGWLKDALAEVESAAAATTSKERRAEWDLLSGKILSRRGEISLSNGQAAEAIQQLSQSIKALQSYLEGQPEDYSALRELARATWLDGKAKIAKPAPAAAIESLTIATETATKIVLSPAQRDSDVFLYVDSFHDMGRAFLAMKQDDNALRSYYQPMQKLRDWDREHPDSEQGSYRLASGYLAIGRILARNKDDANSASKALNQGIRILLELAPAHPDTEIYNLELGNAYVEVADLVSVTNQGNAGDAIPFVQSAVNYLQILTERNHAEPRYRESHAAALTRYAELLADTGKSAEALKTASASLNILEELEREEGLPTEDQSATRQGLARTQSILGDIYVGKQQTANATEAYRKAVEYGQKIVALEPQNEAAKQALNRAQERLGRLK